MAGQTWLDQVHDFVDRKFCQPAVWFDAFFGEDRVLEDLRPTLFVSLKNSVRWTEGQGVEGIPEFQLRYRLPQMNRLLKKARFSFHSGSTADKYVAQPGQPADPGIDPETGVRKPTLGLRIDPIDRRRSLFSFHTGIKFRVPIDPFIRARYQYTIPFSDGYLIRLTEIMTERYVERFSETSQVDFERILTTFTLLRWSNYVTYNEGEAGIVWNSGLSLITQLGSKNAISYDASMWGRNRPRLHIENYRVGLRYRHSFYRPWLFLELNPEVTWPKNATGHRNSLFAAMATLEVQLGR